MDIRYKSFVPRSKQDHNFDQIIHKTSKFSQSKFDSNYTNISTDRTSMFSDRSPPISSNRKKVNVITFRPDESNELVAKSYSQVSNSDNSSNGSPSYESVKYSVPNNLPSILRFNQKTDLTPDKEAYINSASKIIAAKRKAARENLSINAIDESKKKYSPVSTSDFQTKRAVSPEVLNPEPYEFRPSEYGIKSVYSSPPLIHTDTFVPTQSRSHTDIPNLSPPHSNIRATKEREAPVRTNSDQEMLSREKPIINHKKTKVAYNPRPWQNSLDDDLDDFFKLKSENIIYSQKSQTSIDSSNQYLNSEGDIHEQRLTAQTDNYAIKEQSNPNRREKQTVSTTTKTQQPNYQQKFPAIENVKEAYECQENGETQDLLDDVEYLIEGLKGNIRPSTKTLSIISLISKCLSRSYRDTLKAHGIIYKIFNYLSDAHTDNSLAICTAALFLVFSRDRQPRIFHEDSLELLLKLPNICKTHSRLNKDSERVRDRLRLVLDKLHANNTAAVRSTSQGGISFSSSFTRKCFCCRHLKLDSNITTEDLVVECLLQLSTRKTVDWFKNVMRKLGGLDLICEQIAASVEYLGSDLGPQCLDEFVMDRLFRIFNYMRFLEHMTFQNRDNQSYLIDYNDGVLIFNLWRCLKLCAANLSYQATGSQEKKLIQACLMAILRLLANISHDNEWASNQLGCCQGLLQLIFSCLLHLPRFMSSGKRFDLSVLALALLINLAEHCSENRLRMAHVAVSRKRVACLGRSGQLAASGVVVTEENSSAVAGASCGAAAEPVQPAAMGFGFEDEPDEEDMDLDEEDEMDIATSAGTAEHQNVLFRGSHYLNLDCDSSDSKINVLEALVKLFLRHDDRARNNTIIEGAEDEGDGSGGQNGVSTDAAGDGAAGDDPEEDPKWRLVHQGKSGSLVPGGASGPRRRLGGRPGGGGAGGRQRQLLADSDEEEEDEGESSDEGADVEFLISSKEEEAELQKKLSAAGQHMQDSVVSAYTALLLGCILKGSSRFMESIKQHLPDGKFKLLAFVLAKFLTILSITSGMGRSGEESVLEIVRLLEAQDRVEDGPEATAAATASSTCGGGLQSVSSGPAKTALDTSIGGGDVLSYSRYCRDNKFDDDDDFAYDDDEEDEEDEEEESEKAI